MSPSPKCHHHPNIIIAKISLPTNVIIAQISSSPKAHNRPKVIIAQMSPSLKCYHRPNVFIAQILSLPKGHHRPNGIITQMSSSPQCHHRSNVIIAQMSSSPKCHRRPDIIIAQRASSSKCHHRQNVIIAQSSTSPKGYHRPIVIIAQMSWSPKCHHRPNVISIFVLWSFNVFDYYTAHAPPILFLSLYLDISFRYIMVCTVRLDLAISNRNVESFFKSWNHLVICNYLKKLCITCLSTLKETDHWLEWQKRFSMVIFIFNRILNVSTCKFHVCCLLIYWFSFLRSFFFLFFDIFFVCEKSLQLLIWRRQVALSHSSDGKRFYFKKAGPWTILLLYLVAILYLFKISISYMKINLTTAIHCVLFHRGILPHWGSSLLMLLFYNVTKTYLTTFNDGK